MKKSKLLWLPLRQMSNPNQVKIKLGQIIRLEKIIQKYSVFFLRFSTQIGSKQAKTTMIEGSSAANVTRHDWKGTGRRIIGQKKK